MDLPVFVVGLEKSKERYQKTIEMLADLGIEAQLWQGVDGRQPLQLEKGESFNNYKNYALRGVPFSPTEIGCYLSHYRLMKYALTQKWDRIFVMEDDIIPDDKFKSSFKQSLEELAQLDKSFEYIQFGWEKSWRAQKEQKPAYATLSNELQLFRPRFFVRHLFGTWGYAINRQGLEKLLPKLMPMQRELDVSIMTTFFEGLRGFVVAPALAGQARAETLVIRYHELQRSNRDKLLTKLAHPLYYYYKFRQRTLMKTYHVACENDEAFIEQYASKNSTSASPS